MRTLAIFSSIPDIWTATGGSPNVYIEFAAVTQRLLLVLFSCRSGLLRLFFHCSSNSLLLGESVAFCDEEDLCYFSNS